MADGPKMCPLGEACERLQIPPRTFRQLMTDFAGLVEGPRPSGDGNLQEISEASVERLRRIVELRARGFSNDKIREELFPEAAPPVEAVAEVAVAESVAEPAPGAAVGDETEVAPPPPASRQVEAAGGRDSLHRHSELLNGLERLSNELERSEEKRVEDRDRLLTALMRTQQEIQHLRFELVSQASRRARKKKGFFARLFS